MFIVTLSFSDFKTIKKTFKLLKYSAYEKEKVSADQ